MRQTVNTLSLVQDLFLSIYYPCRGCWGAARLSEWSDEWIVKLHLQLRLADIVRLFFYFSAFLTSIKRFRWRHNTMSSEQQKRDLPAEKTMKRTRKCFLSKTVTHRCFQTQARLLTKWSNMCGAP